MQKPSQMLQMQPRPQAASAGTSLRVSNAEQALSPSTCAGLQLSFEL